ncbi:unnamed protein product [Lasius platythorax]|uniref:Uncharacterized protein n=2 Tax=Lasius platythorax TaxID=488582 RepID=A0AAV2NBZ5_9HYME
MKTAPCQFTSNMTELCLNEKRDLAYELISTDQDTNVLQNKDDNDDDCVENEICNDTVILSIDTTLPLDTNNTNINNILDKSSSQETTAITDSTSSSTNVGKMRKEKRYIKQRAAMHEISCTEEKLRTERLKQIIKQEQQLANIKLQHEEKIAKLKEDHVEEINQLEVNNLKEIHNIQVQINIKKLKILEYDLKIKENK